MPFNNTKLKVMANTDKARKQIEKTLGIKTSTAIVLVGGVVTDGRPMSAIKATRLQKKRGQHFSKVLQKIETLGQGFDARQRLISTFATPCLTFGSELQPMGEQPAISYKAEQTES